MKLTDQTVKAAKAPTNGRPTLVWDSELRGFGLRVYPTGARSFVYRYTSPETDRRRLVVLGEYGALTVHKARTKAERYRGRLLEGEDPAPERKPSEKPPTMKAFAGIYVDRMEQRWSEKTLQEYRRQLRKHLKPAFGPRRLDTITRADVAALLDRIAKDSGPYESNRVGALLRAMFNRAAVWGFVPEGHVNPARAIERRKETSRERWLRPDEVGKLMEAVGKAADIAFRAYVPLLLLTGMRKSELLRLRWEDIDFAAGEALLPTTKAGKAQTRQLSKPAREILRFLPREEGNPYVFTGRKKGSHRRDFRTEWTDARTAAGLEDVTMHDLRRTAGSYMAQAGVPLQVIGSILGHQSPAITKVYARLSEENERQALEELGTKLDGLFKVGAGA
jgi:integrase